MGMKSSKFYNGKFKIMDKRQQQQKSSNKWRIWIIELFSIEVQTYKLPLFHIQLITEIIFFLQLLKLSIDYNAASWFDYDNQPFIAYIDLSYYIGLLSANDTSSLMVFFMIAMSIYWIVPFTLKIYGFDRGDTFNNIYKIIYFVMKNIVLLPFFNVFLNLFNCYRPEKPFRKCQQYYSITYIITYSTIFIIFLLFLMGQTYVGYDFVRRSKIQFRLRRSALTNITLILYVIIGEISFSFFSTVPYLFMINTLTIITLVITILRKDEVSQKLKVMQYSFLSVQLLACLFVDLSKILDPPLPPFLFPILAPMVFLAVIQLKTTNLRFELENVNKWPTPKIMISYARKLKDYIAMKNDYFYRIYIHGYMEIHRQKCDNPMCPSRRVLSQSEKKLFQSGKLKKTQQQILRCDNILKKLYSDGYKLTPISPQLQLENSLFLYQRGEKEVSLRALLQIKTQMLPLSKLYCFNSLKNRIHRQLNLVTNKFLDLVSQTLIKRQQQQIFLKFQKAALINLQFWSLLNDDHPDFQKLNQVSLARIKIRDQIPQNYAQISSIAHSQRITSVFASYLQSIQNDENMFNQIYGNVKKRYNLQQKILLQDWVNSSNNIMLVSIQDATFGKIVDVNTSCAILLGYQKFQLIGQSLQSIFLDDLKGEIKEFVKEQTNGDDFFIVHRSGYLIKMQKNAQSYNSMQTGMTAIINLQNSPTPGSCILLMNKKMKIVGTTSSIIPLLELDQKIFDIDLTSQIFFLPDMNGLKKLSQNKQISHPLKKIVNQQYLSESLSQKMFKIYLIQSRQHIIIELHETSKIRKNYSQLIKHTKRKDFQFKVQSTPTSFKYFGAPGTQNSMISQFSGLQQKFMYADDHQVCVNYKRGITTLRLMDNTIQIIQTNSQKQIQGEEFNKAIDYDMQSLFIPKKDEEEIFESKETFQNFLNNYRIASSILIVLAIGVAALIALQVSYFAIYQSQASDIYDHSQLISKQNLINGAVTKQYSHILGLKLASINQSLQSSNHLLTTYKNNVEFLDQNQLQGISPFVINLSVGGTHLNMLSRQFLLSFINYANMFLSSTSTLQTPPQILSRFQSLDTYVQSFLLDGAIQAKEQMNKRVIEEQASYTAEMLASKNSQVIMLVISSIYLLILSFLIIFVIDRINKERISIFNIFLEISQAKIQHFSDKTQKLLVSLHIQESNQDLDDDNDKKFISSTFSKKKSFKQITFSKKIFVKLLIIPFFYLGYFVHSHIINSNNIDFQIYGLSYFRATANADYHIFSLFSQVQNAKLGTMSIPDSMKMGAKIRKFYQDLLWTHYHSFGAYPNFHQSFIDLFFKEICSGINSPLGNTSVLQSCLIKNFANNGTYAVANDLIVKLQFLDFDQPIRDNMIYKLQTISHAHRLLSNFLVQTQLTATNDFNSQAITIMLIWTLCGLGVVLFWGVPVLGSFIQEINKIKGIISILPVSLAKQLPKAKSYFLSILKNEKC